MLAEEGRIGQFTYPFELDVPEWLPETMMRKSGHEESFFFIKYKLVAMFVDKNMMETKDGPLKLEACHCARDIFIEKKKVGFNPKQWKFSMQTEIDNTEDTCSSNLITWDGNEFYDDDYCTVKIECYS